MALLEAAIADLPPTSADALAVHGRRRWFAGIEVALDAAGTVRTSLVAVSPDGERRVFAVLEAAE